MKILNKTLLLCVATAALTACSSDSNVEETFGTNTINLIYPLKGDDAAKIQQCTYSFHIDYSDALMDLVAPSFNVGDKTIRFQIEDMKVTGDLTSYNLSAPSFTTLDGKTQLSNLQGKLYSPAGLNHPVVADFTIVYTRQHAPVMSYNVEDKYQVRTFPQDIFYSGLSTSSGIGQFSYDKTIYRVVVNPEKSTASVIVYNAKLAENMPQIHFALNDLKLIPRNGGYDIVGVNIIPDNIVEGTKYEKYPITSFKLSTLSTDLTSIKIEYSMNLMGMNASASFSGSYLAK